jgi:hypothetical protein
MTVSDENFSNSFRLFHFRHFINGKLAKFGDEKSPKLHSYWLKAVQ